MQTIYKLYANYMQTVCKLYANYMQTIIYVFRLSKGG